MPSDTRDGTTIAMPRLLAKFLIASFAITTANTSLIAADQLAELPRGKQVAQSATIVVKEGDLSREATLRYWLYVPQAADEKKQLPLLLFLHGSGERGDDLEVVKKHGPPKIVEQQADFPFITISPQCPAGVRWNAVELSNFVDHLTNSLPVDRRRVYLTGLSMGGAGSWSLLAAQPNTFAAAVIICGRGDVASAPQLVKTPLWVFHGAKDTTVPLSASVEMVEAIQKAGGKNVKLTVYDNAAHDSWTETYDAPETFEWLLRHTLPDDKAQRQ